MLYQLFIGSIVISLTIVVQGVFVGLAITLLTRLGPWLASPSHAIRTILALIGSTLWMLAAISVCTWIWALTFMAVGAINELEPALYFSIVAFTTLGFGDITLSTPWRVLSGITAANGLLAIGLSTAFLVSLFDRLQGIRQLRDDQLQGE